MYRGRRDVSYTPAVLWIETIRILRAQECEPPG